MMQTVSRILEEKFDYEKGVLDISVPRIELSLAPDEVCMGSFAITGAPGRLTEGKVYTNDIRMELLTDSFSGTMQEIGYSFSAKGLEEGDVVQGDFYIVSNQGEYYLPYAISIYHKHLESSLGGIKNLFHFTNLAKTNWDEAVKLFYSEGFISLFAGNDKQYKTAYYGLSKYYGNEQNVEEFLLKINKKNPIEYILERDTISVTDPEGIIEEYVNITRNGWGYTSLHVETDCDYLILYKDEITDNDFLGNYLSYSVGIDSRRLHDGVNYGEIRFFNCFESFVVKVNITNNAVSKAVLSRHLEMSRLELDMMVYYEAFRTKQISVDTWIAETGKVIDSMQELDENSLTTKLFKAQILMTEGRYNEAKWLLDQAKNVFDLSEDSNSTAWAYYLYLTTLYSREDKYTDQVTEEVRRLYTANQTDWRVAWLLLYLSEEFAVSPSKKWFFIEQQMRINCKSPMMYVEAINLLLVNPDMFTKLGEFELKVIRYAMKHNLVTEELATQFVYLASKEKYYSKRVYDILKYCYAIKQDPLAVEAICELLIKGDKKGPEYYEWYLLALENELRITRVYEYFMESVDITRDTYIPKMAFLYFSYQADIPWEYKAYLYNRVLTDKEENPEIFDSYIDSIREFAVDSMRMGRINKDLSVLYKYVLNEVLITEDMAEELSYLIFMHKIEVNDERATKIAVYQNRNYLEQVYPVVNGCAYVPIYNKDFAVIFEDAFANRYMSSIEYDLEKLMVPGKIATMLLPMVHDNLNFDVYACECSSAMVEINKDNQAKYRYILDSLLVEEDYKVDIRAKLMQYYYDNDEIRDLDELLLSLYPEAINHRERNKVISFMILRGMYDTALDWIVGYGIEGVDIKDVVNLCSKLIIRGDDANHVNLLKLCAYAFFKGKYDLHILNYLIENYEGLTKDLRKLFKASDNKIIDVHSFCEKMLLQMLYSGYFVPERIDIYKKYSQGGANPDIRAAFLAQSSFEYMIKDQITSPYIFEELTKAALRGETILKVSKLAYLKYYSEYTAEYPDEVENLLKCYLSEMMEEHIYLTFFKDYFEKNFPGVDRFSDKTILEYKTEPGRRVFIHYIIEGDDDEQAEYLTEEMKDMYGGIHAKTFILFFGENLLYYITECFDDEEQLTESGNIQKSDISNGITSSRFNDINDIVIAKTLQDYDTAGKLLYDYKKQRYVVKNLFKLQ